MTIKQKEIGFCIYAYCVMDNHVHILLDTKEKDLSVIMKGIAVRYASFYNAKYRRVGHVFQDRFKSEPIEDERYVLAVIRYIHNNPVKAGMVENPQEYSWSSYSAYLKKNTLSNNLVNTDYTLGIIASEREAAIQEFIRFSHESDEEIFLDCEDAEIRILEEGQKYFEKYLKANWSGQVIEEILQDNKQRQEIISHLRINTKLSVRMSATLLGINRNTVERVRLK